MAPPAAFPALGFDPAPGLDGQVTALSATVDRVAQQVAQVRATLAEIGRDDGFWQGEAARNFAHTLGELPPYLTKAEDSNNRAARALRGWADQLRGFQIQAREYERQAEEARSRVQQAHAHLDQYSGRTGGSPDQDARLRQDIQSATRGVSDAEAALREIIRQAQQLATRHGEAVHAAARAVRDAAEEAPPEPGFFDRLGQMFTDGISFLRDLPGKVWTWVEEHKYLVKAIGDFLSDLSAIVGIVSLFLPPPADVVGLVISGALGLGALSMHGLAWAAGAEGINAGTLIFDGVAAASGGFGAIGKLGIKGAGESIAVGTRLGKGGMVAAGQNARSYYMNIDNGATLVGLSGTTGGAVNSAVSDGTLTRSDIPFNKWVPRSATQAGAGLVTGPAGVAFYNYVSDAAALDAADRKAAWLR
jgi:hypothetical protein